jgi:hypothetical protein
MCGAAQSFGTITTQIIYTPDQIHRREWEQEDRLMMPPSGKTHVLAIRARPLKIRQVCTSSNGNVNLLRDGRVFLWKIAYY